MDYGRNGATPKKPQTINNVNNWRENYRILVSESHSIGSLAVIRSLGRAGYPVIAASPQPDALGFHSRYCKTSLIQPGYDEDDKLSAWLDTLLEDRSIRLIIPSEAFLLAIRPRFTEFRHILPVPQDESLVYGAISKFDLFQASVEGGLVDNLPPFLLIASDGVACSEAELRALGEPLFLKVDAIHARNGGSGAVYKCETAAVALRKLDSLRAGYRKILVQGHVDGIGVGAFLAQWHNQTLAEFMHRRIHEVPHWGGASSFRESWKHAAILEDARARMAHMSWEGVGMWEYRWNPGAGKFHLMEFNSRFWGSLHLALFANVDFPRLLADAIFDHPNPPVTNYPPTRCRLTFPKEVEYIFSRLKDKSLPWSSRLSPIAEFITLGLDPRVHSDLNFPGDRLLYGRMMVRSIRRFLS